LKGRTTLAQRAMLHTFRRGPADGVGDTGGKGTELLQLNVKACQKGPRRDAPDCESSLKKRESWGKEKKSASRGNKSALELLLELGDLPTKK